MSKRPPIDLMSLTSETAAPMSEAIQRAPASKAEPLPRPEKASRPAPVPTQNLEALAFKVSPTFRKRFRRRAVEADLKLNELLFEALDAWEEKRDLKK